jgi:2-keto-3-deoxy-galactonokinase
MVRDWIEMTHEPAVFGFAIFQVRAFKQIQMEAQKWSPTRFSGNIIGGEQGPFSTHWILGLNQFLWLLRAVPETCP